MEIGDKVMISNSLSANHGKIGFVTSIQYSKEFMINFYYIDHELNAYMLRDLTLIIL